jgi:hypothetical protein
MQYAHDSPHNQNATTLLQPTPTAANRAASGSEGNQALKASVVGAGSGPERLKIRVSVVRFRPWPPFSILTAVPT